MKYLALALISVYQKYISPWFPKSCRYVPTCSEYSKQAFVKYSFFKALWIALKRLGRCHPFAGSGYDPLP